jgi:hypothetical protein
VFADPSADVVVRQDQLNTLFATAESWRVEVERLQTQIDVCSDAVRRQVGARTMLLR